MLVKQISNLITLMELYARVKTPLSVQEIVNELGWPRSSTFNVIETLIVLDYLHQPKPRGGYYPTSKWLKLSRDMIDSAPLAANIHELLTSLCAETGETIFLTHAEGNSVVFEEVVESTADIRFIATIGRRLPIHIAASGRAILQQYTRDRVQAQLKHINYHAHEKSELMDADAVIKSIKEGAERGWHINNALYAQGVTGIAVPFMYGDMCRSIALGGPESRLGPQANEIGKLLKQRVHEFLQQLIADNME